MSMSKAPNNEFIHKKSYTLYGGPLHLEKREVEVVRRYNVDYSYGSSVLPIKEYYEFKYSVGEKEAQGFEPTNVYYKKAVYKVELVHGQDQKYFPMFVYSGWTINDAFEFIFNNVKRVVG